MFETMYTLSFNEVIAWLAILGATYTAFGYFLRMNHDIQSTTANVIDALIDSGYLKTKKNADGEVEILKYNEN